MVDIDVRDSLFIPSDNRENFKDVIAKRSDLVRKAGGRLAPSLYSSYQYAGLVLGYATSGGDAGFYKAYNAANTDGSQTAVGVLDRDANVDAGGDGSEIVIIKSGDLLQALLIGLDSGGITNMGGHSYLEHGTQILSINC
jgi:hypothetical protein